MIFKNGKIAESKECVRLPAAEMICPKIPRRITLPIHPGHLKRQTGCN